MASLIGILAAGAVALVVGVGTFERHEGVGRPDVDRICRETVVEVTRVPRRDAIARAAGMARVLRTTASELRSAGVDDLAWAFQTWAAADDDIRRSLRIRRSGSARAGAAEWVARTDAATAAGALGARRCVQLARLG